ncbi:hypothetical protein N0V85_001497 [Neurospora sp. IMI 360204]|nr:hypothetical protein N0V85_001497 [Neurospora sp. IMI 360204]
MPRRVTKSSSPQTSLEMPRRVTRSSAKNGPGLFDFIGVAIANGNVKYDIPEQYQHLLPSHLQNDNNETAAAAGPLIIRSSARGTYVEKGKKAAAIAERANKITAAASAHATEFITARQGKNGDLDINIVLPVGDGGGRIDVQVIHEKGEKIMMLEAGKKGADKVKGGKNKKRKFVEVIEEVVNDDEQQNEDGEDEKEKGEEEYVPDGKPAAKKRKRIVAAPAAAAAKKPTKKVVKKVVKNAPAKKGGRGGKKKKVVDEEVTPEPEAEAEAGASEKKDEEEEKGEEGGKGDNGDGDADEDYEQQDRNPDAELEE